MNELDYLEQLFDKVKDNYKVIKKNNRLTANKLIYSLGNLPIVSIELLDFCIRFVWNNLSPIYTTINKNNDILITTQGRIRYIIKEEYWKITEEIIDQHFNENNKVYLEYIHEKKILDIKNKRKEIEKIFI